MCVYGLLENVNETNPDCFVDMNISKTLKEKEWKKKWIPNKYLPIAAVDELIQKIF